MAQALVVFAAGLILCFLSSFAELQRFHHAPKPNGSLSFLVVGDWGRRGAFNQSQVATQMGIVGEKLGIDFVISTGDNFYDNGLTGVDDGAFEESFTNVYTAKSLQKQWYAVLGNHDYRGDVLAQLSPVLRKIDSRWLCLRSYVVNSGIAEFFFVDTSPFVKKYWTHPKDDTYDWREVAPRGKYIRTVFKDLESALRESTADWKIVIGHHTMRSIGHHGNTKEIVDLILPLLRAYNVDFYVNGHDHCLEHISDTDSPLQFLTSGAGSKAWRGDVKEDSQTKFFYDGQGLMSVEMTQTEAEIVFYDVSGLVMYKWSKSKHLRSTI